MYTNLVKVYNILKITRAGTVNLQSWKRFQGFLAFHEIICLKTD